MKDLWLQLKDKFLRPAEAEGEQEGQESYVEVNSTGQKEDKGKIVVRPFVMEEFEDIRQVLDVLREGTTVALINIKPLRDKDLVELKRAIAKLRKTCEAIDGDIAGVGEDYVVAVPYFARIHRNNGPVATEELPAEQ